MSEEHLPRYDRVLEESKTIVIKMGSSLILKDSDDGKVIDRERLNAFIQDISKLVNEHGKRIVLVSSGAVGLGRNSIPRNPTGETLEEKQAAATVGNPALMAFYTKAFEEKGGLSVGQVLMTPANTREPRRRYNIRNTIHTMLDNKIIPIINENDAVTTYSIRYGDNDSLASYVAHTISADTVILLTDVLGFYENFGKSNEVFKTVVNKVTTDTFDQAGGAGSDVGTGGMATKIKAAKIATEDAGCNLIIACGRDVGGGGVDVKNFRCPGRTEERSFNNISRLFNGNLPCTLFRTQTTPNAIRQLDIQMQGHQNNSCIVVKNWNTRSIENISPENIIRVMGDADRGQPIEICVLSRRGDYAQALVVVGWGVLEHSLDEVQKIRGLQTPEDVTAALKYAGRFYVMKAEHIVRKQVRQDMSDLLE